MTTETSDRIQHAGTSKIVLNLKPSTRASVATPLANCCQAGGWIARDSHAYLDLVTCFEQKKEPREPIIT